jgi:hypothetical protein
MMIVFFYLPSNRVGLFKNPHSVLARARLALFFSPPPTGQAIQELADEEMAGMSVWEEREKAQELRKRGGEGFPFRQSAFLQPGFRASYSFTVPRYYRNFEVTYMFKQKLEIP